MSIKSPVLLQKSDQQSDKDKRLSRSQMWRSNGKESKSTPIESESTSSEQHYAPTSNTDERGDTPKQDARRLRNKDRPDRPVWTVRRRGETSGSPPSFNTGASLSLPGKSLKLFFQK